MRLPTLESTARFLLPWLACATASAVPPAMPSDALIQHQTSEQMQKSAPAIDAALRQARTYKPPVPDVGTPSPPSIPDPAAIAQRYQGIAKREDTALYIMVSLSMPESSLAQLAEQASRADATLVLRGVVANSLQKTAERSAAFIKRYPGAQFQIDPTLYRRYAIRIVPTFVLARANEDVKSCTKGCDASPWFVSVAGDVSLDYALEYFARHGGDGFVGSAEHRLKTLRAGS